MSTNKKSPEAPSIVCLPVKHAYTIEEVEAVTGFSVWTIRLAIGRGELKAKRFSRGGTQVVLPADLYKWLGSLEDVPPSKSYSKAYRAKTLKQLQGAA